jgi:hypothetical protein
VEQTHLERMRSNEETFAAANEQIREAAEASNLDPIPFLCECSTVRCTALMRVPLARYMRIREHGHFLICPGHDDPEVEHLIEDCGSYYVVEKFRDDPSPP